MDKYVKLVEETLSESLKLKKAKGTAWKGNGFGNSSAEWNVVGTDIFVSEFGGYWNAIQNGERIARAWEKKDLLKKLKDMGIKNG